MRGPPIDDVGEIDALFDRIGESLELWDHALPDRAGFETLAKFCSGEARNQARLVIHILQQPWRSSQIDDLLGIHRNRDRPRRLIGIYIIREALGIRTDGRMDGPKTIVEQPMDELRAHIGYISNKSQIRTCRSDR